MKLKNFLASFSALAFVASATFAQAKDEPWVKVGGFLDAQYQYLKEGRDPGFVLNDGALYLEKEYEMVKGKVDLPFKGSANSETATFDFAQGKAQAYVALMPHDNFEVWAGIFDTPYGFELNDSKDLTFTHAGVVYGFLPTTHTGLMVAGNFNGFTVKGLVSNPGNRTNLFEGKTAAPTTGNVEFGGQFGYSNEMLRATAGILHHQQRGGAGANNLYSLTAGVTFEPITLDTELEGRKIGGSKFAWGVLAQVVAKATEELSAGARFEWARDKSGIIGQGYENIHLTVGPQYSMSENFKFKLDYSWLGNKAAQGARRENEHKVFAAALFIF